MTATIPSLRRWFYPAAVLTAALALGLNPATAGPADTAQERIVRIDNFTFSPEVVTVAPGTTVTWINGDDIPHTVVSPSGRFRSKTLDTDDRFTFTFPAKGEYPYFCSLHPHMTGKVVVRDAPE
ncbi:cupredoxin domain-containing protein [Methylobacterium persicinum]|uniref:Plastocyanin n=1 Tax=Methylobacterium persicinum TaxID=374426 RepID=A0ABU0HPB4_9HYPH|nr:cupredoxin family copper-binding protein [Methylobacterium persicinum]MDQ0444151.1 plastocyanin [Methylobacterium persicinum]GJE40787.1 Plastocyanin [Methylobacterium persicinum]